MICGGEEGEKREERKSLAKMSKKGERGERKFSEKIFQSDEKRRRGADGGCGKSNGNTQRNREFPGKWGKDRILSGMD